MSVWDLKPFLKKYTFEESTHDEEKRLMLVAQPTVSPSSSSSSSSLETTTTTTTTTVAAQPHQGQGHGKKKEPEYTEAQVDENGCAIVLWNRLLFPKKKKSEGIVSNRYLYMHPEDREPEAPTVSTIEKLFSIKKTVVIMCHGGYFAAGVFDKARLVAHKTFHSYIVRRKQGGRQSNRDKNGRRPKSGGAQIRRHNEEKHLLNVRALVNSWADHLTDCDLILTHLPSHNKTLLIDKEREVSSSSHASKQHQGHDKEEDFFLSKNDPRLRTIPFATHRPSLSEVKRVFLELTTALLVTFEAPPLAQILPASAGGSSSSSSVNLRTSADPSALVDELRSSGDWEPSFKTRTSDDEEDDEERDEDDDDHEGNSDQDDDEDDDE